MYIVSTFPVVSLFNFSIKETALCFKPYLSNTPITGNVNMNNDTPLFETKESPKIVKIWLKSNPATIPVATPANNTVNSVSVLS